MSDVQTTGGSQLFFTVEMNIGVAAYGTIASALCAWMPAARRDYIGAAR